MTARAARLFLALSAARLFVEPAAAGEVPLSERRSGYEFMSRETRAMQDDDTGNPGTLWVLDGEALWKRKTGAYPQRSRIAGVVVLHEIGRAHV